MIGCIIYFSFLELIINSILTIKMSPLFIVEILSISLQEILKLYLSDNNNASSLSGVKSKVISLISWNWPPTRQKNNHLFLAKCRAKNLATPSSSLLSIIPVAIDFILSSALFGT